jgi:hypothetical protein
LLSRRRQATSPTMTTAVASATRPRCLEPWPAVVSSGDCYCRCNAHTHTMPHTVFIFARKRTPPAIYVHVYWWRYFRILPLGEEYNVTRTARRLRHLASRRQVLSPTHRNVK